MRIVPADPPMTPRRGAADPHQLREARHEWLGLAVTTAVVLFGVWTVYRQEVASIATLGSDLNNGAVVDLRRATPESLSKVLTTFPSDVERRFVATAVTRWVREHPPTHIGALAGITVPVSEIRADPRLTTLADRARANEENAPVRLFTASQLSEIKPALVVRSQSDYTGRVRRAIVLFLGAFWFAHLSRRLLGTTGNGTMLPVLQLLTGLAVIAMISLRDPVRDTDAVGSVAMGVVLGCAALVVVSAINFENTWFRFQASLPLAAAVGLALLLVIYGSGPGDSGVKVNLFGVQPIEAIRLLAVFALAAVLSRRWETVRAISETPLGTGRVELPRWRDVSALVVIVSTLLIFFFLQRDLGPALVLGCLSLALYGVARGRVALVLLGFALLVVGFAIGYQLGMPATVAKRVAIWLDPWDNGLVRGDQIAHGLWALASGGVRGVGLGVGDGRIVPAAHTDLIIAVIGEDAGFIGVATIAALYVLLVGTMLRVSARAPGDYSSFLAAGCALSIAVPAIVIVGGVFGAIPLSGVATPFLSFGKSSMIASFVAVGVVMAIARRSGEPRPLLAPQLRMMSIALAVMAVGLTATAVRIQAWSADALAVRPSLVEQGDRVARYQYNPRLLDAARRIPRGAIYDRNGLVLGTSDPAAAAETFERLRRFGQPPHACDPGPARCYPLGGAGFHLVGDWDRQTNWNAPNASFVERDYAAQLQGFDDQPRTVQRLVRGKPQLVVVRDYRELLPLVRHKGNPRHPDVQRVLQRQRDVHTSIDLLLQAGVARALESRIRAAGVDRGAAVVIDPDTGELLAAASYPYPEIVPATRYDAAPSNTLLDRARYGLYPPGSTFKLITAAAALRSDAAGSAFICMRLPDGRVGARVPGVGRPIRDDVMDHVPHGHVDLHKGIVISCNAYFAQLAIRIGPQAIIDTAAATGIKVANDPVVDHLRRTLPFAGYGQGEVVATPLRLARVVGAIAADGMLRDTTVLRETREEGAPARRSPGVRWLMAEQAALLATSMRDVVTEGTGRALAKTSIAGKTGTAEVNDAASHSWFVGFAPYAARGRRIAFATIVENAGYGGRVAAPLAGDVVAAARAAGVIR